MTLAFQHSSFRSADRPPQERNDIAGLAGALDALWRGERLHLQLGDSRSPMWSLDNGAPIAAEIATQLLVHPDIVPTSAALTCQPVTTWRARS